MIDKITEDVRLKYKDNPKRYEHILGVVKTAVSLSLRYGVDSNKAYIAAIFHDYTKYDDINSQTSVLDINEIKAYEDVPVMYHALSAAAILKNTYNIEDETILNAIKYHVYGRVGMTTLDKIILIADKIEPTRDYPLVDDLRKLSLESLDETIKVYLNDLVTNPELGYVTNKKEILEIIKSIGE